MLSDQSSSMLGIMAAAAERLSSMESSSVNNAMNDACDPSSSSASSTSSDQPQSSSTTNAATTNAATSSSAKRPKLILPELTPDLQEDLESTTASSKNNNGNNNDNNFRNHSNHELNNHNDGGDNTRKVPFSVAKRPEWVDYPFEGIVGPPHPNDVLCGRGGGSNNHPGNESFRELVNEVKVPYVNCPKREKPLIARRIVEAVRNQTPPGRFLQKDTKKNLWYDIGDAKAREKTSQALREGAPIIRDLLHVPSSGCDVAMALKEAKKGDRTGGGGGGSCGEGSPGKGPVALDNADAKNAPHHAPHHVASSQPLLSKQGPPARIVSSDGSSHNPTSSSLPPLKRLYSRGEQDASTGSSASDAAPAPQNRPRWSPSLPMPMEQGRQHFLGAPHAHGMHPTHGAMPGATHAGPHHGVVRPGGPRAGGPHGSHPQHLGPPHGRAPPFLPRRSTSDYGSYPPPQPPRFVDSIPIDTVRMLLLGRLDPVQFARHILSPEEAALVAHRAASGTDPLSRMRASIPSSSGPTNNSSKSSMPAPYGYTTSMHVISDAAPVSDDSTSGNSDWQTNSSTTTNSNTRLPTPTDQSAIPADDVSSGSEDGSSRLSNNTNTTAGGAVETTTLTSTMSNSQRAKSALPKKKRKFTESV